MKLVALSLRKIRTAGRADDILSTNEPRTVWVTDFRAPGGSRALPAAEPARRLGVINGLADRSC